MLNKKREGNIMVIVALILIILPSLLIVSKMGGSSTKVLKGNIDYHQELLLQDSLKSLAEDTMKIVLQDINDIEVSRDVIWVDGLQIYGNYYVVPNTIIDLSGVEEKFETRESLYSVLEYDVVNMENLEYDKDLTTYVNKETPFEHSLVVKCLVKTSRKGVEHTYQVQLTTVFDVNTDIDTEKGYISNIVITDASIIDIEM